MYFFIVPPGICGLTPRIHPRPHSANDVQSRDDGSPKQARFGIGECLQGEKANRPVSSERKEARRQRLKLFSQYDGGKNARKSHFEILDQWSTGWTTAMAGAALLLAIPCPFHFQRTFFLPQRKQWLQGWFGPWPGEIVQTKTTKGSLSGVASPMHVSSHNNTSVCQCPCAVCMHRGHHSTFVETRPYFFAWKLFAWIEAPKLDRANVWIPAFLPLWCSCTQEKKAFNERGGPGRVWAVMRANNAIMVPVYPPYTCTLSISTSKFTRRVNHLWTEPRRGRNTETQSTLKLMCSAGDSIMVQSLTRACALFNAKSSWLYVMKAVARQSGK